MNGTAGGETSNTAKNRAASTTESPPEGSPVFFFMSRILLLGRVPIYLPRLDASSRRVRTTKQSRFLQSRISPSDVLLWLRLFYVMRCVAPRAFYRCSGIIWRYLQRHSTRACQEDKTVYLPHNIPHLAKLLFLLLCFGLRACFPKGDVLFR